MPRRSIFPDCPVVLEPPTAGVRVGQRVRELRPVDSSTAPKPYTARLVGLFLVLGGIWAFVHVIGFVIVSQGLCCFWLPMFLELPWGVAAIIRGGHILFATERPRAPTVLVLLQVHTCATFDMVNTLLGVLNVLMLCGPRARAYFRNEWGE